MSDKYITIKVFSETRKLFRLIAAMTGEQMSDIAHRLATEEWRRLQAQPSPCNEEEQEGPS